MGRPKLDDATKPGELRKGNSYFRFIADEYQLKDIKAFQKDRGITMKDAMFLVIGYGLRQVNNKGVKSSRNKKDDVTPEMELKLKKYLEKAHKQTPQKEQFRRPNAQYVGTDEKYSSVRPYAEDFTEKEVTNRPFKRRRKEYEFPHKPKEGKVNKGKDIPDDREEESY